MKCPNCGFEKKRETYLEGFDVFWDHYPRRVGKGAARKVWSKIKPDQIMLGLIIGAIQEQKETEGWKKDGGIYIPHPSTWLNQERWLDETQRKKEPPKYDPEKMAQRKKELADLAERVYVQRNEARS